MIRRCCVVISLITGIPAVAIAPSARADDIVTYEVYTTSSITALNVEYNDLSERRFLENVALPWRFNATVGDPISSDAEIRADWITSAGIGKFVYVRVYYRGSLLCENRQDVGTASCNGSATIKPPSPRRSQ